MKSLELKMQRKMVEALIDSDSVMVSLIRASRVETPSGSWTSGAEATLPPQKVALIPFLRRLSDTVVDSQFGAIPNVRYIMVGQHDLDVQVGDSFHYSGQRVRVDAIDPFRDVRTSCAVVLYG